jgi:hypothetical protein
MKLDDVDVFRAKTGELVRTACRPHDRMFGRARLTRQKGSRSDAH